MKKGSVIVMFRKLSVISVLFLVSACATQTPKSSQLNSDKSTQVAKEEASESNIICKRIQKVGTHFKKKQCWTKEDYAEEQRQSREAVERAQRSGMTGPEGR